MGDRLGIRINLTRTRKGENKMTKQTKQVQTTKTKIINIIRWISLLPVACAEIWAIWSLVTAIEHEYNSYYKRAYVIPAYADNIYNWCMVALIQVAPLIAIFFTTRFLAPKYKTATSLIVVGLSAVFMLCVFFYGLAHIGY